MVVVVVGVVALMVHLRVSMVMQIGIMLDLHSHVRTTSSNVIGYIFVWLICGKPG